MHAIVRVAGVQARVALGDKIQLPLLDLEVGSRTQLGDVLLVSHDDAVNVGTPVLEGVSVEAEVLAHKKDKKVHVFKKKRRKRYRVYRGHRQQYTEVKIMGISGEGIPEVVIEERELPTAVEEPVAVETAVEPEITEAEEASGEEE